MAIDGRYRIRPPRSGETAPLTAILAAMERHYDAAVTDDEAAAAAARLLGGHAPARCLVAPWGGSDGVFLGIALFAPLFPGARFRDVMVLKDLFVLPEARGNGLARALVAAVAQAAIDAGCERLDWMTDRGNAVARAAYSAMGAAETDKVTYSVTAQRLARLAATGHADPRGRSPSGHRGADQEGAPS
ncbi:MAG: GNAT family N-acetyltransferase [Acetobacteraceae bacterium]|jgi:GNAT superfamily N-acetyltransferase|nr:GNAT family N-acetyltransferase [Acetobacteraceae bacterium]